MRIKSIELQWTASFDASLPSASRLLIALSEILDDFDAEPFLLPLEDAPIEIPRLLLRDKSDSKRLTISGQSISFSQKSPGLDISDAIGPEMIARVLGIIEIRFNRIGVVRRSVIEHESAPSLLISRFASESAQNSAFVRSEEFQIHNLKKYAPASWSYGGVNSWVRMSTGTVNEINGESPQAGVIITQDINTDPGKESQNYSVGDIRIFADICHTEMNQIIDLYFSEDSIEWIE